IGISRINRERQPRGMRRGQSDRSPIGAAIRRLVGADVEDFGQKRRRIALADCQSGDAESKVLRKTVGQWRPHRPAIGASINTVDPTGVNGRRRGWVNKYVEDSRRGPANWGQADRRPESAAVNAFEK